MSRMDVSNLTKLHLQKMFSLGKRFDSRGLLDFRHFSVEFNISNKAEGSARVRLGKTEVIVGVKLELGEPYADSPDKGNLMVSGDLLPLASPKFESGPPGFNAIELPRLVDRAIRGSEMIDLKSLVVEEGKKVWTVIIDIYPINDDGNLIDASTIGAVLALRKTKMPEINSEGKVDYKNKSKKFLPLEEKIVPISFSFYKLGDSIILDPNREEEESCEARITFGASNWKGEFMINSCQKKEDQTFTQAEVAKMMSIISKKYDEIYNKLKANL